MQSVRVEPALYLPIRKPSYCKEIPLILADPDCAIGWTTHAAAQKCYWPCDTTSSRSEATTTCTGMGAKLAEPRDQISSQFVADTYYCIYSRCLSLAEKIKQIIQSSTYKRQFECRHSKL